MQIERDGNVFFRTAFLLISGKAFVDRGRLCQQSVSLVTLGRIDCGPVYRRDSAGDGLAYAYVNATNVFYFSPIE